MLTLVCRFTLRLICECNMSAAQGLQELFTNSSVKNTTGARDWSEVYEAVKWIQLVMALLSILGSGSIIICVMLQRLCRAPELQPLLLLSASDMLLALCWLSGAMLFSKHCNSWSAYCYNLHTVEQMTQSRTDPELGQSGMKQSSRTRTNCRQDAKTETKKNTTDISDLHPLFRIISCSVHGLLPLHTQLRVGPVQGNQRDVLQLPGRILCAVLQQSEHSWQSHCSAFSADSCAAYDAYIYPRKHQQMSSQLQRALQVSTDAHRSTVPDLRAAAANQSLQPAARLQHHHLPCHLHRHTNQHHSARGECPGYLQASCGVKRLPWQPAASLLPSDEPTDAPVPVGLRPLLGSSGEPGFSAGGEALSVSGRRRGSPLRITGLHLSLSGFPQLSGLRMDSCAHPSSLQDRFVSGRGHSDAPAAVPEEGDLPVPPQHQLKDTALTG